MKKKWLAALVSAILTVIFMTVAIMPAYSAGAANVPVKGMVTMVDLGAKSCIPCKMMAPILEKMEKRYKGRARDSGFARALASSSES